MNYYPFHLGDYAAHTAHLEPMEDLAYRRMLDLYYRTEAPLSSDWRDIARLIRMKDNGAEIEAVLSEFFELTGDGWRHFRCDSEISRMQDKQAKARASAQASVNARIAGKKSERSTNAQRTLNERSTDVELPTPTPTPTPTPIQEDPPAARVPPAEAGQPVRQRASKRCPESFDPSDELRAWALTDAPRADFNRELAKFRDHTFKTAHSDWAAAFRNWLRRASDDAHNRPQSFMAEKKAEMSKWIKGTSLDRSTQQDYIDAAPLTLR